MIYDASSGSPLPPAGSTGGNPELRSRQGPSTTDLSRRPARLGRGRPWRCARLRRGPGIADAVTKMLPGGGGASGGFRLPIIEGPVADLRHADGPAGRPGDVHMAPLELKAEFSAFFSIFGPLGVSINAEFARAVRPVHVRLRHAGHSRVRRQRLPQPAAAVRRPLCRRPRRKGNDVPELQFDAGLWAAAELNLGIARGGVGGGLFAEIDFEPARPRRRRQGAHQGDGHQHPQRDRVRRRRRWRRWRSSTSPASSRPSCSPSSRSTSASSSSTRSSTSPTRSRCSTSRYVFDRCPTLATELGNGVLQLNIGKNAAAAHRGRPDRSARGSSASSRRNQRAVFDMSHVLGLGASLGVDESEARSTRPPA